MMSACGLSGETCLTRAISDGIVRQHRLGVHVGECLVDLWVVDPTEPESNSVRSGKGRCCLPARRAPQSPLTIFARMSATRPVFWITGAAFDHAVRT